MSNINVYISDCFYGYIIRLIGLAPVPTLNFDFGFFWLDLATFYVSFGSFGLRPPGNPVHDYKQYRVLPRVVYFQPKQKAAKFYQVCNLFVTLFLIVYILLRVK